MQQWTKPIRNDDDEDDDNDNGGCGDGGKYAIRIMLHVYSWPK